MRTFNSSTTPRHACAFAYKFTGKERDTESGLDYFGARYYGSNMGRFMSPDWSDNLEAVPYANLADPQSLNLYRYAANNPLRFHDADGHTHTECSPDSSSTNADGVLTVTSGWCRSVPDWWNFPGATNWLNQARSNAQQVAQNAVRFAGSPRGKLLGKAVKHIIIGGVKGATAVGGVALAPETGGASLALTAYGVVGATGDLTAGASELLGLIFGRDSDIEKISNAGDAVTAVTTVFGASTLIATGGNLEAASHAASIEDIVLTAGAAGFAGEGFNLGDSLGLADDTSDLSGP